MTTDTGWTYEPEAGAWVADTPGNTWAVVPGTPGTPPAWPASTTAAEIRAYLAGHGWHAASGRYGAANVRAALIPDVR
jgi:hypothetical protein